MVTVREVKTKKDIKKFIEFPLRLYKKNRYFVPCLYSDEKKLLCKKTSHSDIADTKFFLAEREGRVVGRIQGIIQKQYNDLNGERRIRFTRFDSIDDKEVSKALFRAVEEYGRSEGMDTICGPLGFSDLDREGLLIEGFDQTQTFEEQYNYEYYPALVEDFGLKKEIDWLEFRLFAPENGGNMFKRVAERVLEMQGLHLADQTMSKKEYIQKYKEGIFYCIDECYKHLYGTVPLSDSMKREIEEQFMILLSPKHLIVILDKDERVVSFALGIPAIGEAVRKSGGRLTPLTLMRILRTVRRPRVIDLALIGVLPEYQNAGLTAVYMDYFHGALARGEVDYFETNLNLETNTQIISQWKYLKAVQHKRRRSYIKSIN